MQGNSSRERFEWKTFNKENYFPGFYSPMYKIYCEIKIKKKLCQILDFVDLKKKQQPTNNGTIRSQTL